MCQDVAPGRREGHDSAFPGNPVSDPESGLFLGFHMVGAGVSGMADEFALVLEMCATPTDVADTIRVHPTLGETVQETALKGRGRMLPI